MIILFKYCTDVKNCENFRGFYFYIYIYILVYAFTLLVDLMN